MNRRDEVEKALQEIAELVSCASEWWEYENEITGKSLASDLLDAIDRIYGVLPDDGEVASRQWLVGLPLVFNFRADGDVEFLTPCGKWIELRSSVKTRYQFRRLCEALGGKLKEVKGG